MLGTIYSSLPFVLIATAALTVFGSTLVNEFVWDDKVLIIGKPIYRQFDLHSILLHPHMPANGVEYLPVRDLSYTLDYYIWGQNALGFHLTNVLLYIVSAALVYLVVDKLCYVIGPHPTEIGMTGRPSALPTCTALLFVVHPLHSQVVSFVMARNTLLSGLFFFVTLFAYLEYITASNRTRRFLYWLSAFVCCLMAFLSKGTSITLPVVIALALLSSARRHDRNAWIALTPFFLASILTAWLFSDVARHTGVINTNPMDFGAFSPTVRMARAVQIPWFYLSKLIMPLGLAPEYDIRFRSFFTQPPVLASSAALLSITALAWHLRRSHRLAVFAIGSYFAALLPVLNLLPTKPIVADRYAYLPSFGFCLLAAYALVIVMKNQKALIGSVALVIGLWSVVSISENRIWRNDRTLFEAMIAREPELAKGYVCLGYRFLQEGQPAKAISLFKRAAELDPSVADFEFHMGILALKKRDFGGAIAWFDKVLLRRGTHIGALFLAGAAHVQLNDLRQASQSFARVLSCPDADINDLKRKARFGLQEIVKPFVDRKANEIVGRERNSVVAHRALAELYYNYHLFDDAIRELRIASSLGNHSGENLMLADSFAAQGVDKEALAFYTFRLKEKPEDERALYGAGEAYRRQRNFTDALECYRKASLVDPSWDAPLLQKAVIYFLTGKEAEARSGFNALRRYPHLQWRVAAYEERLAELH